MPYLARKKIKMSRAANLEVRLPPNVRPTEEATDALIKKFLKECSKESLVQFLYEKSAMTRRFEKKCVRERNKRMKYKRNAKKHNEDLNKEFDKASKKQKNVKN